MVLSWEILHVASPLLLVLQVFLWKFGSKRIITQIKKTYLAFQKSTMVISSLRYTLHFVVSLEFFFTLDITSSQLYFKIKILLMTKKKNTFDIKNTQGARQYVRAPYALPKNAPRITNRVPKIVHNYLLYHNEEQWAFEQYYLHFICTWLVNVKWQYSGE